MIRAPPEVDMSSRRIGENPVKIIRWSANVKLPSGDKANMYCIGGSMEEVMEFAKKIAEENGVTVEAVV